MCPRGFWAYDQIEACYDSDIVKGYSDYLYHPGDSVTRDQMPVYIARAEGWINIDDPMDTAPELFPDVPATGYGDSGTDPYWACRYIEYCVEHGVVNGYDDGYYYPENPVTRDQMAVYVARAFELPT